MQYFDFKGFLLSFLFFLGTCQFSEPASVGATETKIDLTDAKNETQEDYSAVASKFTLVLLQNRIYAYEGNELNKGAFYDLKSIGNAIKHSRNKFSEKEFIVLIKPSSKATYRMTVDVLDEMQINKIDKYVIVDLTDTEKKMIESVN